MESTLCHAGRDPKLSLIETLRWTGERAERWELHLARLVHSAQALGWPDPTEQALQALHGLPDGPVRLRLDWTAKGVLGRQIGPVPPVAKEWAVALAGPRLNSADPLLAMKTNSRAVYDAARAELSPGIDEMILLNERGEVCEGSISTLFFDRGAGMRTPPLSCGLLAGVLRAELACPEEILLADDLGRVRLWMGNSLRGLIPARFVG